MNAVCVGSALGLASEKKLVCFPEEQETSSSCSGPDTEGCAGKIHLVSALRCCRESALSLRMNHSSWPSRAKEVDQILMANPLLTECVCVFEGQKLQEQEVSMKPERWMEDKNARGRGGNADVLELKVLWSAVCVVPPGCELSGRALLCLQCFHGLRV